MGRPPALETLAGGTALAGLALFFLAPGAALPHVACPFHALTHLPCLTCGGTRALEALAAGHLGRAIAMNPLVALGVLAAAAFVVYAGAVVAGLAAPIRPELRRGPGLFALRIGLPFVLAANWAYLVAAGR